MTDLLTAAKAALERLNKEHEALGIDGYCFMPKTYEAMSDLRIAIAEAEKAEPVAWITPHDAEWMQHSPNSEGSFVFNIQGGINTIPLYLHPAPTATEWKDHDTALLVNELRDIAVQYQDMQQLRERIAHAIRPLAARLSAPRGLQE